MGGLCRFEGGCCLCLVPPGCWCLLFFHLGFVLWVLVGALGSGALRRGAIRRVLALSLHFRDRGGEVWRDR